MSNQLIIQTSRLIIREILPEDDEGMFAMDRDAEVHRYLGGNPNASIQQSRDNIAYIRRQYADYGIGRWAVTLKDSGAFVGWTGFKRMTEAVNGHTHHLDFGYRHARAFWCQGYGFEAAQAALNYGLDVLGFRAAFAMTDVENTASRRLLEKLGFRFVEIFPYDGAGLWLQGKPTTWYELQA